MTKTELVAKIAVKTGLTKVASEKALNAFWESVLDALLQEGRLNLSGFGSFGVEARQARKGRNPRTGAALIIPAGKVVKFRPGKKLKESVK